MVLVPIFIAKYHFGPSIFIYLNLVLILESFISYFH